MDTDLQGVLVVDQDEAWREALLRGLAARGFSVSAAASMREGRELVRRSKTRAIVLDLMFPDAQALRFVPTLRRMRPDTAVVICTAHGSIAAAVAAMRLGVKDFLLKPTTPEQVGASLRHALGGREPKPCPAQPIIPSGPMPLEHRSGWNRGEIDQLHG